MSVGTKLYFLPVVTPFFILPLLWDNNRFTAEKARFLLAMVAGFGLAILPVSILFMRDRWLFLFDNLHYHQLVTELTRSLHVTDALLPMTFGGKLNRLRSRVLGEASIAIPVAIAITGTMAARLYKVEVTRENRLISRCVGCALLASLASIIYMTPMFWQYIAMPIPYLLLLAASAYAMVPPSHRGTLKVVMWIGAIIAAVSVIDAGELASIGRPGEYWTPIKIERLAAKMRGLIESNHVSGKVATLQPIFATEANLPIYPELASGPFLFSVGDMMNATDRFRAVGTSPRSIGALFDSDPPAAILVDLGRIDGTADERVLEKYAIEHHYRRILLTTTTYATLYLRGNRSPRVPVPIS